MPADDANYIAELNDLWPLLSEEQHTWPGHYHAIKRTILQTFPNVDAPVEATPTELNLLSGKTALFNGILATPARQTAFNVPITSGLALSFSCPEALVGDYVRAVPDASYPAWQNLDIPAAWVTSDGNIALFFFKIGTSDAYVLDTGPITILLVRPPA